MGKENEEGTEQEELSSILLPHSREIFFFPQRQNVFPLKSYKAEIECCNKTLWMYSNLASVLITVLWLSPLRFCPSAVSYASPVQKHSS